MYFPLEMSTMSEESFGWIIRDGYKRWYAKLQHGVIWTFDTDRDHATVFAGEALARQVAREHYRRQCYVIEPVLIRPGEVPLETLP